jgi:outer membrane immunogenic protein
MRSFAATTAGQMKECLNEEVALGCSDRGRYLRLGKRRRHGDAVQGRAGCAIGLQLDRLLRRRQCRRRYRQFLAPPDCFDCANTKFQEAFGMVGLTAGYNYQFGHTVLGIEGDYNWSSVDKTKDFVIGDGGTTHFKMDEFATLRARAGLALDQTFLYATAGVAFAHIQNTTFFDGSNPATAEAFSSEDKWKAGLAVGGGIEFALTHNWTLKGEYMLMQFQNSDATVLPIPANFGTGGTCEFRPAVNCRMNYSESIQMARVGLNYRF